jgi:hypothetical protein
MVETIMAKKTQEQMQADWTATKNIVGFQEMLNGETDDGRYKILSQLLSDEFGKFKKPQAEALKPLQPDSDRAVVNFGNPLAGLLLGALMIAATMGGFFVWDNYQASADAMESVLADQN